MQKLGKFGFKINIIPNGLEKHINFSLDNKLVLSDSFQFLSSSLDSLMKNLDDNNSKYLSREFDSEELDLVRQKD